MDVSLRTIYRDVDSLRRLSTVIDDEEIEALVLGLREVAQVGDRSLAEASARVLAKLKARLPPRRSHRLEHAILYALRFRDMPQPGVTPLALRQAVWDEVFVAFDYVDKHGAATRRSVDPLGITVMDVAHCLLAWCRLRKDFRAFRLDRTRNLQVSTGRFRPRDVPMLRNCVALIRAQSRSTQSRTEALHDKPHT